MGAKRLEITLGRCKRPPQVLCSHGVWCTSLLRLAGTYGSYLVLTCRFAHFSCHIYTRVYPPYSIPYTPYTGSLVGCTPTCYCYPCYINC